MQVSHPPGRDVEAYQEAMHRTGRLSRDLEASRFSRSVTWCFARCSWAIPFGFFKSPKNTVARSDWESRSNEVDVGHSSCSRAIYETNLLVTGAVRQELASSCARVDGDKDERRHAVGGCAVFGPGFVSVVAAPRVG